MTSPGHYWCDICDEPAFGSECQRCHRPARLIIDDPPYTPIPQAETPSPPEKIKLERGFQLFAEMKAKLFPKTHR